MGSSDLPDIQGFTFNWQNWPTPEVQGSELDALEQPFTVAYSADIPALNLRSSVPGPLAAFSTVDRHLVQRLVSAFQ
jgi:hypothetical protein